MKNHRIGIRIINLIIPVLSSVLLTACIQDYLNPQETISDVDGNEYKIVKIGEQTWMAENLRTTRYNDNEAITLVKDTPTWISTTEDAFCFYLNNSTIYGENYGAFYNCHVVESGKLCPTGWHVPSDEEFQDLIDFIGTLEDGGKLKEKAFDHWKSPNEGAEDAVGFAARGSGYRNDLGEFKSLYEEVYYWTSTEFDSVNAWAFGLNYDSTGISHENYKKTNGFSVRCIKD